MFIAFMTARGCIFSKLVKLNDFYTVWITLKYKETYSKIFLSKNIIILFLLFFKGGPLEETIKSLCFI